MVHDFQTIPLEDGVCGYCKGETRREGVERIEELGWLPVTHSKRLASTCRQCRRTCVVPLDATLRKQLKTTAGLFWRVALAWLWVAGAIATVLFAWGWMKHIDREHAAAPIIGDRWTVDTDEWTVQTNTQTFENAAGFGVVKVVGFDGGDALISACDMTYGERSGAEENCKTFRMLHPQVALDSVPALYDGDAISNVRREGDTEFLYRVAVALGGYCLLLVVLAWSTRRYLLRQRRKPA